MIFNPTYSASGTRLLLVLCCLLSAVFCPRSSQSCDSVAIRASRQEITLTGYTRPRSMLVVASEVAGRCLTVAADVGQPVPDDGIFCRLDPTFTELHLAANETARQQASRQLRHDETELRRHTRLASAQATSQTQSEQAELQHDLSRLKLTQLETEAKSLRETRTRHLVPAPAGWLVLERLVEPGAWVSPGQPLARLGDFSVLTVPLSMTQEELSVLRGQDSIPLLFPESRRQGGGTLERISPDFDPMSRKTKVEIFLTESTASALPQRRGGLRVVLPLSLPDPSGAVLVPASAVTERHEEHWLTRATPELQMVRVMVLGRAQVPDAESGEWLRVVSPEIREGEHVQLHRSSPATP